MPEDESFLARWSRRKAEARQPEGGAGRHVPVEPAPTTAPPNEAENKAREPPRPLTLDDFKDVDFDALDASSDYQRFMGAEVPEEVRSKALARMWTTDPILSQPEPFFDYAGDYTDAAVAVPGGLIATAYKVGQGFLTDAEAAEWDRLGRPEPEVAGAGAAMSAASGSAPPAPTVETRDASEAGPGTRQTASGAPTSEGKALSGAEEAREPTAETTALPETPGGAPLGDKPQ